MQPEQFATFKYMFDQILGLHKLGPSESLASIDTAPYRSWAYFMERRARQAYLMANWRPIIITEQRTTDASGIIAFDQAGKRRIGALHAIYKSQPNLGAEKVTSPVRFVVTADGAQLANAETGTFWVTYKLAAPRFTTVAYVAGSNYPAGTVVFWPTTADSMLYGDCYEARVDAAGTGFYWDRQVVPLEMADWIIWAAWADSLKLDGQKERANVELEAAELALMRAAAASTAGQGNAPRAQVRIGS